MEALVGNAGKDIVELPGGEHFCQIVIIPIVKPEMVFVNRLIPTKRGEGKFGSTTTSDTAEEPLPKLVRRDAVAEASGGAQFRRCACGYSLLSSVKTPPSDK